VKPKIPILPLLVVNFVGTLGYSIMIPFLVYLVNAFKGNDFLYGVLGASYSVFQLVGAPLMGRLSDTFGRKKLLLVSEAGSVVAWAVFFIALYLPVTSLLHASNSVIGNMVITLPLVVLFFARAVDGITAGDVSVANAYLADITEEKDRKKNFGQMGAAANMGFILGPLIAAALGNTVFGLQLPITIAGAISLAALVLTVIMLPESSNHAKKFNLFSRHKIQPNPQTEAPALPKMKMTEIARLPGVPFMLLLYFMIFLGFNLFYTAFPLFAIEELKWNVARMGIFFAILSGMLVLVEGPILTVLSKRFSDETLVISGNLILVANFLLIATKNEWLIYLSATLFAVGNGISWPSFLSILSHIGGNQYQGAVQGLASSAGSLSSVIGLIMGGILFHRLGALTFIIVAAAMFVVFLLTFRLKNVGRRGEQLNMRTLE